MLRPPWRGRVVFILSLKIRRGCGIFPVMTGKQKKRLAIIVVVIIAALGGSYAALMAIQVDHYVYGAGYVTTPNRSKVLSVEKGPIKRVLADDGQRVNAGQVLLELEDSDLLASVDQYKAEVNLAKAELEKEISLNAEAVKKHDDALALALVMMQNAQNEFERAEKSKDAMSAEAVEKKKLEFDVARARYDTEKNFSRESMGKAIEVLKRKEEMAQQQLDAANATLARRKITSPIAGVLSMSILAVGEIVDPSRAVGEVFDDSSFIIRVKVLERSVHRVKPGQPASAEISAYPHRLFGYFTGKVQTISQIVTPQSTGEGHVIAEIVLDKSDKPFKPGMSGDVRILVGRTSLFNRIVNIE